MKSEIYATEVIQDFNRRGICPDWEHDVSQGKIKLWRLGQQLLPELHIGETIIAGRYSYRNTLSPQSIADDLMDENKLRAIDIELINAMQPQGNINWLTTVEIEEQYGLPKGSVRRDIHRGKFQETDLKKIGRDWTINVDAANKLYNKDE